MGGIGGSLDHEILKEAKEIEHHFHSNARWLGISGDQSGDDWAIDDINSYQAISGDDAYGADADDEAKVLGTDDTPIQSGMTKYDFHELLIEDVSVNTVYKLRIVYGTGTMADAITAGQYSQVMVLSDPTNPQLAAGIPVEVNMPRLNSGIDKVWVQAWNATNNATVNFFVGVHEYLE